MTISFLFHHGCFQVTQAPNFIGKQHSPNQSPQAPQWASEGLAPGPWDNTSQKVSPLLAESVLSTFESSRAIRDRSGKPVPHCQQPLTAWWAPSATEELKPPSIPAEITSSAPQRRYVGCMADLALTLNAPLSPLSAHSKRWPRQLLGQLQREQAATKTPGLGACRELGTTAGQEHPIYLCRANSDVPCQPCTCQKPFAASLVIWEPSTWGIALFHTICCDSSSWYHRGQHLGGTKLPFVKRNLCELIPLLYQAQIKIKPRRLPQLYL